MIYDNKRRQCLLCQCPVMGCSSKGNQLARHLTGKKHRLSESDTSSDKLFCTRLFKYVVLL